MSHTCLYFPTTDLHSPLAGTHIPSHGGRRLSWLYRMHTVHKMQSTDMDVACSMIRLRVSVCVRYTDAPCKNG